MRGIMHYDAEFRREEAIPAASSHANTEGRSGRLERWCNSDPPPMLDRPGVMGGAKPPCASFLSFRTSIRPVLFGLKDLIRKL